MAKSAPLKLHVLGSGCPSASADRYGSAFILETPGDAVMVDCGPATAYKMARMDIPLVRVGHVFLTHLHYDHCADIPCFALSRWDQDTGSLPPLTIHGPVPTEQFVQRLFGEGGAFYDDWRSRVTHPASEACHRLRGGSLPRPAPVIQAHDLTSTDCVEGASWHCRAQWVHHVEPTLESLAYRFETDAGTVVFAGDCGDCAELRQLAHDADTLVVACTHFGTPATDPDLADVITGTPEVAAIANEAGVRRVVLTHGSPNFAKPGVVERAVAEVARAYGGAILYPDELTTIDLTA